MINTKFGLALPSGEGAGASGWAGASGAALAPWVLGSLTSAPGVPPGRRGRTSCWPACQGRSAPQSRSPATAQKGRHPVAAASPSSTSSASTCSVPSW